MRTAVFCNRKSDKMDLAKHNKEVQKPKLIHRWVGKANRYGMDGPGAESRWERDFPHHSRPTIGPAQPPIQLVPVFFLVV
jgi:hypothetical protein